jgi:hypothetical protein
MEKELQEIKASMEASPNSHSQTPHSNTFSPPASLGYPQNEIPVLPDTSPDTTHHASDGVFTPQKIDEIEIQPSDIAELLQRSMNSFFCATAQHANVLKILYALSSPLSNPGRPCFFC